MNLDLIASEREKTLYFIQRIKKEFQITKEREVLSHLLNSLDPEILNLVTTTFVSNDIIEICNSTIDTIEPNVRLNDVKLGGTEFIFLETPIPIDGNQTKEVNFILVMVQPATQMMTFIMFKDSLAINGCISVPFDTEIGTFGTANYIYDKGHQILGKERTVSNCTKVIKYYLAICSWRSSKIVVNEPVKVSRAFRKRATHKNTDINTIKLRRKETTTHSIGTREYTHRWIVRGFFRRQWYPKSQCHKLIFVDSFIKGPAGTELKVRQQVHLVNR